MAGSGGGNVSKDQHRLPLRPQPAGFGLNQGRQRLLKLFESGECRGAIHTESIRLHHAHIPLTVALLNGRIP